MSPRLFLQGQLEKISESCIVASVSQRLSEVDLFVGEETGSQLPVRGEPEAIAAFAEVTAHRTDKPNSALGSFQTIHGSRSATVLRIIHREWAERLNDVFDLADGEDIVESPGLPVSGGHILDETDVEGVIQGEPGEGEDLIIVETSHGDDIDFDRMKPDPKRLFDARPYLIKATPPRDVAESLRSEESRLILTRLRPAEKRGSAKGSRSTPLVVRLKS